MVVESMVPGMLLVPVLPIGDTAGPVAACAFLGGFCLENRHRGACLLGEKKREKVE